MASTDEAETLWYRHREQGSLHQVVKGSEAHRRCISERTVVDEEAGEVPEPVFEAVSAAEVKKAIGSPERLPGHSLGITRRSRRRESQTVVVHQPAAGPSEDEFQARIDAAAKAAAEQATEALIKQLQDLDADKAGANKPASSQSTGGK